MEFYFAFSSILFERYRNKNSKNDKSEILPSIRYEILSRRKANEKKKRLNVIPREKDRRIRKADNYARRAVDPTTWFRSSKQDLPRPSDLDKKTEVEALGGR